MSSTAPAASPDRKVSTRRLIFLACLSLACVVGALVVPIPFHGRVAVAVGDLVHGPLFFCVTLGVLYFLQRVRPIDHSDRRQMIIRCLSVFVLCSGFGLGMEGVQKVIGRSAAVHDAIANTLGAAAAVCFYVGWNRRRVSKRWFVWAGMGVALIAVAWYRPLNVLLDVRRAQTNFPDLCDFRSELALTRWYLHECSSALSTEHVTDGPYSMRLDFRPAEFPSATLIDFPKNWRRAEQLALDVTLDPRHSGSDVEMMIKVIDRDRATEHSDTFRATYTLSPGETQSIRLTRAELLAGPDLHELNLGDIEFVSIALIAPTRPATLYVDGLKLQLLPSDNTVDVRK
ncbi:VanZ family protein [Stieleria varia]|uniref:VanZ like family protein n=1 Tax=Stieleria varia TaxID=2528005 RepID=A0A5C6ATP0_9BACT|nr:hypothetical protein [Stieleria varia]TWU02827.1 VanZ like family protein [Stieleria varia]